MRGHGDRAAGEATSDVTGDRLGCQGSARLGDAVVKVTRATCRGGCLGNVQTVAGSVVMVETGQAVVLGEELCGFYGGIGLGVGL